MSPDSSPPQSTSKPWLPFLLLGLAVLFAHGLALRADFYMDDKPHILTSERIQEGLDAPDGLFKSRHLTYALWRGLHLAFGNDPVPFHAVNLLLHLGVSLLFLVVARQFLRLHGNLKQRTQETVAFWGTLLFAVHPLVSEPVNYAAQTSMLLMMFFATLATYHLLRWHETKRPAQLGFMALAILLASHAKEPGVFHALIPLLLISLLIVPRERLREKLLANQRLRLITMIGAGGALTIVLAGGWAMSAIGRFSDTGRTIDYALTQSRVLVAYLSRVLVPTGLSSDHHIPWTTSASDLPALAVLILVVASALAILYFAVRKRSWYAVLCGLALFHLYLRYAYSVDELMVEYRMYPAMPWIGLLLALGITRLLTLSSNIPAVVRPVAFASLATLCMAASALRSHLWSDEEKLTLNVIEQYPSNLRAWSIYLGKLSDRGNYEDLAKLRNLPQDVFQQLFPPGYEQAKRQFTPEKTYHNFIACQYPLIKALVHQGELDEAMRRSDMLLVDVLEKVPSKNAKATFTMLLAKLLTHAARGEDAKIEEVLVSVSSHYDETDKIRRYLAAEVSQLPQAYAASMDEEALD